MSFRSFCRALRMSDLPEPDPIAPRDFASAAVDDAVAELLPWLDDLVSLWAIYCRAGGFPRAVADQVASGDVGADFSTALWDVVHGDALQTDDFTGAQSLRLLVRLSKNLASPVNMSAVAEDVGVVSHQTAGRRVKALVDSYLAWPCHKRGDHNLPHLAAQSKIYFTDPLIARLASLRADQVGEPDPSQLSEQQLGIALVLAVAEGDPTRYADFSSVMYARTAGGNEVDFCGRPLGGVAFEGKYVDDKLGHETRALRALFDAGVLATRAVLDTRDDGVRAIPAAFIGYLLRT
jgi:predicted AAA+ superfamily ATPase